MNLKKAANHWGHGEHGERQNLARPKNFPVLPVSPVVQKGVSA
jgi:hypothetical protein